MSERLLIFDFDGAPMGASEGARVAKTLEKLSRTKKAVLSHMPEKPCRLVLGKPGLAPYFDLIVGSDSPLRENSLSGTILRILSQFGVKRSDAVIISGNGNDLKAGKEARVGTIGVTWTRDSRPFLSDPDCVIDDIRELLSVLSPQGDLVERRREKRYSVPEVFSRYVAMKVRLKDALLPVRLHDFSKRGFKMESTVSLRAGAIYECIVSVPRSLSKEIVLTARVSHCRKSADSFIAGCEILSVESELWFRVLHKTLQFILERRGELY